MNLVEAGLYYLRNGMSVIPFKRDKSGACVQWKQYQELYPSPNDVKNWFEKRFSKQFIAIVTGKISNLMVVDCDTEEAYQTINELLPDGFTTPVVKSPHGWHLYFKFKPGLVNKANYMPGVDVRSEAGCIIAPPSVNGDGIGYSWMRGLSMEKVAIQEMPLLLFDTLMQYVSSSSFYNNARARITDSESEEQERQNTTNTTNSDNLFKKGSRDQDIFHIANCLVKGGCNKVHTRKVLEILSKNCDPPFDEKEIDAKIESALNRKSVRDRNLAFEVREWVLATNGDFSATNCDKELHLATKDEKRNLNKILERLSKENPPLIEKAGNKNGWWRLIDQSCIPEDWVNADCNFKDIWMPLSLGEICGVQPGNILIFAGAKDAGKTAFLMNIAKENRHKYKIHYFNSEMGKQEFKLRASLFPDISVNEWFNFYLYNRSSNFHDVLKKGEENINIIDYLEAPEEAYRIGPMIKKIHDKLEGALCIIGLQKKFGQDLGRGAEFSLEKARLYVSLEYGKAKIVSCKNFKPNDVIQGNPRGYLAHYKLVDGCRIVRQAPGWISPAEQEKMKRERI